VIRQWLCSIDNCEDAPLFVRMLDSPHLVILACHMRGEAGCGKSATPGFRLGLAEEALFEKGQTAGTTQGRCSRRADEQTRKHSTGDEEFTVSKRLQFSCADMRATTGTGTGAGIGASLLSRQPTAREGETGKCLLRPLAGGGRAFSSCNA